MKRSLLRCFQLLNHLTEQSAVEKLQWQTYTPPLPCGCTRHNQQPVKQANIPPRIIHRKAHPDKQSLRNCLMSMAGLWASEWVRVAPATTLHLYSCYQYNKSIEVWCCDIVGFGCAARSCWKAKVRSERLFVVFNCWSNSDLLWGTKRINGMCTHARLHCMFQDLMRLYFK